MRIHKAIYKAFRDDVVKYIRDIVLIKFPNICENITGYPFPIDSRKWWDIKIAEEGKETIFVALTIYGMHSASEWEYDRIRDKFFPNDFEGENEIEGRYLAIILEGLRILVPHNGEERPIYRRWKDFRNEIENEVGILLDRFVRKDHKDLIDLLVEDKKSTFPVFSNNSSQINDDDSLALSFGNTASASHSSTPKFLNLIPQLHDEFFGRGDELLRLKKKMSETNKIVLLNGLGGIGKTTLAKKFVHDNQDQFTNIAWVTIAAPSVENAEENDKNFISAFTSDTTLAKGLNLHFPEDLLELEKYNQIMHKLQILDGRNLLVIDNAENNINHFRETLPIPPKWVILITSRENLDGFVPFPLDNLNSGDAIKLFRNWYTDAIDTDEIIVLLEAVGFHTLMVELLAKTLKVNLGLLTVNDVTDKLKDKNLDDYLLQDKIFTTHSKEERTLLNHLLITFRLFKLSEDEIYVLKCFYFLLPGDYSIKTLTEWFDKTNNINFINALKTLYQKGWLQFDGNNFQMHRLIQVVIYYALKPGLIDANPLIKNLASQLWNFNDTKILSQILIAPYAAFVISQFANSKEFNIELGNLCLSLAIVYGQSGQIHRSETIIDRAIEIYLNVPQKNNADVRHALAVSYLNKSHIFRHYRRHEEELYILNKAINIWENLKGIPQEFYLINFAAAKVSLGTYYKRIGDLGNAKNCYLENLQLHRKLYDVDQHKYFHDLVLALLGYAGILIDADKFNEAKSFAEEAENLLEMRPNLRLPLDVADALATSAIIIYETTKNIKIAQSKFDESIRIYEAVSIVNENIYADDLANKLRRYGGILSQAGRLDVAEIQYKKAEFLLEKQFTNDRGGYLYDYVKVLGELSHTLSLQKKNPEYYFDKAQKIFDESKDNGQDISKLYYYVIDVMGVYYTNIEDFSSAIKYFEISKAYYLKQYDQGIHMLEYITVLNNLARSYSMLGQFTLAADNQADFYNFALELFEENLIDGDVLLSSADRLATLYFQIEEEELTLEMFKWSFVITHLYTDLDLNGNSYLARTRELPLYYGLNFKEWFEKEVAPHIYH